MNKKYVYFVSFWQVNDDNSFGIGNSGITISEPVKNFSDVMVLEKAVAKNVSGRVTVINFQLLSTRDEYEET